MDPKEMQLLVSAVNEQTLAIMKQATDANKHDMATQGQAITEAFKAQAELTVKGIKELADLIESAADTQKESFNFLLKSLTAAAEQQGKENKDIINGLLASLAGLSQESKDMQFVIKNLMVSAIDGMSESLSKRFTGIQQDVFGVIQKEAESIMAQARKKMIKAYGVIITLSVVQTVILFLLLFHGK